MTAPLSSRVENSLGLNASEFARLNNIRIVLIHTTLPANIGSAARAMHTMGLQNLTVVSPKHPIDDTSVAHAAGAQHILSHCQVVDTLEEALADSQIVFAASSRQRHIPRPVVNPSQAAQIILNHSDDQPNVSILFGREDRGLTNAELALADYHIQIEANPAYPVLNVASAVQVIASFIYSAMLAKGSDPTQHAIQSHHFDSNNTMRTDDNASVDVLIRQKWDMPAITYQQKSMLQSKIIDLMAQLELIESNEPDNLKDLPNRLSRLVSRIQLDQKEYELINAIIAKIKLKL